MIFDKIENTTLYKGINSRVSDALTYLETADFAKLSLGKHEIDGDNIFAIIYEYSTKESNDELLEAHKKYIDIQYMVNGNEYIGVTTYTNQKPVKPYDKENDYMLFNEPFTLSPLNKDMFAILFPDDIHMPGIRVGDSLSKVKKVVIKVKI